jgi:mono/diheme cytochrome c family protein
MCGTTAWALRSGVRRSTSRILAFLALASALACGEQAADDATVDSTAVANSGATTGAATSATTSENAGALYVSACATCHETDGAGLPAVYPPLAGSPIVTGPARTLVRIVIGGLEGPLVVKGESYNSTMPPYGGGPELNDDEIAAVLTYLRSSFGNSAPAVSAAEVAREREASAGRVALWTPAELGIGGR